MPRATKELRYVQEHHDVTSPGADGYRHGHAYHGSHPFFMWNNTAIPRRYLSKVYFAGVKEPEVAERCGFEAFETVESAIEAAEAELGGTPSIALLQRPPGFIPRVSGG